MPPVTPTQALKTIELLKRELAQVHEQAVVLQRDLAGANRRIAELVYQLMPLSPSGEPLPETEPTREPGPMPQPDLEDVTPEPEPPQAADDATKAEPGEPA